MCQHNCIVIHITISVLNSRLQCRLAAGKRLPLNPIARYLKHCILCTIFFNLSKRLFQFLQQKNCVFQLLKGFEKRSEPWVPLFKPEETQHKPKGPLDFDESILERLLFNECLTTTFIPKYCISSTIKHIIVFTGCYFGFEFHRSQLFCF